MGVVKNKNWRTGLLFAALTMIFWLTLKYWPWYTASLNLPPPPISVDDAANYQVGFNAGTMVHHAFLVIDHFFKSAIAPLQLLLLPGLLLAIFDRQFWKVSYHQLVVGTFGVMMLLVLGGTYYFSFAYRSWNLIGESLTRLIMVVVPILIYALSLSSFWSLLWAKSPKPLHKPAKHSKRGSKV